MKKLKFSSVLILIILGFIIFITNCSKSSDFRLVDPLIMEFIMSKDFQTNELLSCKTIDYDKSNVMYFNDSKLKPIITVVFSENGRIIASVEAIKNYNENIKLPNENKYFMLYRDFERFDFNSLSGTIRMHDLNYDNWLFSRGEIFGNEVIKADYFPVQNNILYKYDDVISENLNYINKRKFDDEKIIESKAAPLLCDANNNGNISYSECYSCFNEACKQSEMCSILCYFIGDYIGQKVFPRIPMCQTSISAACIYISIEY